MVLLGLRIQLLPPRSTAKYQPLDLGQIAYSKISNRSNLLRTTINVMLESQFEARDFPSTSHHGIYGVREGFLPTVGDAMDIFDES